jgi:hypothetical protein
MFSGISPTIPDKMPGNDLEIVLNQTKYREISNQTSNLSVIDTVVYSDNYVITGVLGPEGYLYRIVIYDLNDPTYRREILNPNGTENEWSSFGSNIKVSGDYIIISDYRYNNDQGIIYVYKFSDTSYFRIIKGSNTINNEMFGDTLYIQGDYLITVTDNFYYSYLTNPPRIYIFKLGDESYRRVINHPYNDEPSNFGKDIYFHGDYLSVNMPNEYSSASNPFNDNQTIILIYKLSDESYLRTITKENVFVEEIHIQDDFLVLGSSLTNVSDNGLIIIYKFSDETYERIINCPIDGDRTSFGNDIQIHQNYIVISSFQYNVFQGIIFIYRLDDIAYERIITGPETTEDSGFGSKTILHNDYLVVRSDFSTQGRVFVYKFSDETYERVITEPNNDIYHFGFEILVHEENLIISSVKGNFYNEKGKIYIYRFDDEEYKRVIDEETLEAEDYFSLLLYVKNGFLISMAVTDETSSGIMYLYKFSDENYKRVIEYIPGTLGFGEDYKIILNTEFLIIKADTYSPENQRIYVFKFDDF